MASETMACGCRADEHPECQGNKDECHIHVPGLGWEYCGCRERDVAIKITRDELSDLESAVDHQLESPYLPEDCQERLGSVYVRLRNLRLALEAATTAEGPRATEEAPATPSPPPAESTPEK